MIRFRPYPGLTIATLLGLALLVALGVWQLHRLDWKLALIAAANTRAHAAPAAVEGVMGKSLADAEYTHAEARGTFLPGETFLFSQLEDGRIGFDVIAPFRLEGGAVILIDRGFVPEVNHAPATHAAPPTGETRVTGLVRGAHAAGLFTGKPDLARRIWYGRDPDGIAKALGVSIAAPIMLAADAGLPGEAPEGGHTRLIFRNEHLSYALTWFGLAATLVVIYFAFHWSRGRLGLRFPLPPGEG